MSDDEADDDIYENLPNFFLDETYKNLEEEKNELKIKVEELGKQLDELKKENDKLAAKVKALGKNISCLYKTAVQELERKDQVIAQLRRERDDMLFRRGGWSEDHSVRQTKRSSRKQLTPTKKVRNGNIRRPDPKVKTSTPKLESSSSIAKATVTGEPEPLKEKTPEKITPAVNTAEVKVVSPDSESKPLENKSEEEKHVESKHLENHIEESNSKEETITENSLSERTPANVSNIQILSGSEDSFAQTPASDKFTSHAITEDCGFGRRRKVRRIIRATSSSAGSTPVRTPVENDAHILREEQPPSAKRICSETDLSSATVCDSADKSPKSMKVDSRNNVNAVEESACGKTSEIINENNNSKDSSVPLKGSDNVRLNQEELVGVDGGRQAERVESNPRKEDERHRRVVFESCEVDLKVSSTDDQSTNSGNLSIRSHSECSPLSRVNHTAAGVKVRTTTYLEEYSVSSVEFDGNKCVSSGESSTPKSDRAMHSERDGSPVENRGKRPRSWERERNHVESTNQNLDDGKRMRHSPRDSYRDRDRRDSYYGRDYKSSRVGGERMRRMERDLHSDRNYRNRMRDQDDDRPRGPDSTRHRDDDRRDCGRYRRSRSRERRSRSRERRSRSRERRSRSRERRSRSRDRRNCEWSSGRNRDNERGSRFLSRDRSRREVEERSGNRGSNKGDIHSRLGSSPKTAVPQGDENSRSNCVPPTEWD